MVNNLGCIEFVGTNTAGVPVLGLIGSFSFIVAFPVKLAPGHINQFIQIEAFGEYA